MLPICLLFGLAGNLAAAPGAAPLTMLRQQAANPAANALPGDAAKHGAGRAFDGFGSVQLLEPIGYVDVPGSAFDGMPKVTRELQRNSVPEVGPAGRVAALDAGGEVVETTTQLEQADSYHFVGKPTKLSNLILYTAVADRPGEDTRTEKPKKSFWQKFLKPMLLGGGILATLAGILFPPLLFLGGLLLGAYATIKALENMGEPD